MGWALGERPLAERMRLRDMEDIIAFMQAFVAKEYEAYRTLYAEREYAVFAQRRRELDRFFSWFRGGPPYRFPDQSDEEFDAAKAALDNIRPRTLFQIKQYEHPVLGNLYRSYTSDTLSTDATNYFANFFVAYDGTDRRIVAEYLVCLICQGSGEVDEDICPECNGEGWEHFGGIELDLENLGPLIAVRRLQPPDSHAQRMDYVPEQA